VGAWQNYYVIIGSSGAALIGIQFVVITLIAGRGRRPSPESLDAFGTPTVVHLSGALVVAAIMSAPWVSLWPASVALVTCGLAGLAYSAIVIGRARRQTGYQPVWEDWLWHAFLPCTVYGLLTVTAFFMRAATQFALFGIGAAALVLLFIGIHNAWDTVTHIVLGGFDAEGTKTD